MPSTPTRTTGIIRMLDGRPLAPPDEATCFFRIRRRRTVIGKTDSADERGGSRLGGGVAHIEADLVRLRLELQGELDQLLARHPRLIRR